MSTAFYLEDKPISLLVTLTCLWAMDALSRLVNEHTMLTVSLKINTFKKKRERERDTSCVVINPNFSNNVNLPCSFVTSKLC